MFCIFFFRYYFLPIFVYPLPFSPLYSLIHFPTIVMVIISNTLRVQIFASTNFRGIYFLEFWLKSRNSENCPFAKICSAEWTILAYKSHKKWPKIMNRENDFRKICKIWACQSRKFVLWKLVLAKISTLKIMSYERDIK